MPVAIENPTSRTEPIGGFGFSVEVGGNVQGWFTECSGLSIEREVKAHPEGGVNDYEHQLPGRVKQSKVTLKHGLAGNELWEWFQKGLYDGKVERRNLTIRLYNSDLSEAKAWNLIDAFPAKWTGPGFNSANNDITFETLEVVHHGLKMIDWA